MLNERPHKKALRELAAARDEVKVKAHLLSMEARERWQMLESKLDTLEHKLERGEEKTVEAAVTTARELTEAIKALFERKAERRPGLSTPVSAIMSESVRSCSPGDSLNRAAQIMWESNCGAVPVVAEDGTVLGVVTDRDISMACYTRGSGPAASSVASVVSRPACCCSPDDTIERACAIMGQEQVRRLPVAGPDGRIVGIITLADIACYVQSLGGDPGPARAAFTTTLAAISERRPAATDTAVAAE
jgi:CBS domain-containing protein